MTFPSSSSVLECSRTSLLVFFLICASVPCRSEEPIHGVLRELARRGDHDHVMSPSPSPLPATTPATQPVMRLMSCDDVSNKCYIENYSVTACVPFVGNGSEASFVVVVNGGESSLQLNIVVHPANMALDGLVISGHQVNKIKLASNMSGDSSILVKVGNNGAHDECTIHLGEALIPQGTYMTSTNAAYLFFAASGLFMGGSWACCKMRQKYLDEVPYQELQMEHQLSNSTSVVVVGTRQGWDQSWDGEWDDDHDEEKAGGTMRTRSKVSEIGDSL